MNKSTRANQRDEKNDKTMADDTTPEQSPVQGTTRKRKRQDPVRIIIFKILYNFAHSYCIF